MIPELDTALRRLIERDVVNGAAVDVAFEAPDRDWVAKRTAPSLDVFLYDIREDKDRRDVQYVAVRDESGRVLERRQPPRVFAFSYLVSAWAQRAEDEHRLLAAVLACLLRYDTIPGELLPPAIDGTSILMSIAWSGGPGERVQVTDVWASLEGFRPSIGVVLTTAIDAGRMQAAAPVVLERLVADVHEWTGPVPANGEDVGAGNP